MTPYILVAVGLFLILLEFYLPGAIMGVIGALLLISAIVVFITEGGSALGLALFIAGTVVAVILVVKFALWSIRKTSKKNTIYLNTDQEGYRASSYEAGLKGKKGVCTSHLRPGGTVMIEGKKYSAISIVGYVEKGDAVEVIDIEGETLKVRRV
jgi:membrane-bound serine protease (ClpP class)